MDSIVGESVSESTSDSIQVFIRIKPGTEESSIVHVDNEIRLEKHQFGFDRVFPKEAEQEDIFNQVGKKLITHTLDGYNGCVFVYGQTGSGKTYTMIGLGNGLMQRSFIQLFARINRMPNCEWLITCSYYQLYNEQIIDLLDPKKDKRTLSIRHDVKKGVFVQNLTEQAILSSDKLMECLNIGMKNRHIGQTQMNRQSSRSHSIFTISLSCKTQIQGKKVLKTPKLHFVDLAGSQRQKLTMATGDRLKQAGNINKSLTSLGMVINALASQKARLHIPYRDSKLTTILRNCLGGNSKTFIVATISTSIFCFQETLSTLNFANRAKMVKVKALINEESLSNNIEHYKEEIKKLKGQILRLKSEKRVSFQPETIGMQKNADIQHHFQEINSKISIISEHLKTNICSPSLQNLVNHLQTRKQKKQSNEMQDEEEEGDQNELLEYLSSNYQLLSQINKKMNEYIQIKDDLRNMAFNKKLAIEEIKTPSKFQRDQYEQLISKRQEEIKELEDNLSILKHQYTVKQIENKDLRRKVHLASLDKSQEEKQELSKLREQLSLVYKTNDESISNISSLKEERSKLLKTNQQLEGRLQQFKELYVYSEEKYQNQKYSKSKLETQLNQLSSRLDLANEKHNTKIQDYLYEIQSLTATIEDLQSKDEQQRNQIQVLAETCEFNQKIINEYSDKMKELKKEVNDLNKANIQKIQILENLKVEYYQARSAYETQLSVIKVEAAALKRKGETYEKDNIKIRKLLDDLTDQYDYFKTNKEEEISQLERKKKEVDLKLFALNSSFEKFRVEQERARYELERGQFELQQKLSIQKEEKTLLEKEKSYLQEKLSFNLKKYEESLTNYKDQSVKDQQEILSAQQKISNYQTKIYQLESFIKKNKNLIQQHENVKKAYMDTVKQNYKLKGEYAHSSSTFMNQSQKNQELISKVAYYQQKFKLMSIEYSKATEIIKRMKQKEMNLLKRISFFQENERNKRIYSSAEDDQAKVESFKLLQQENQELKLSIIALTKQNQQFHKGISKNQYLKKSQIQLKQSQIRKMLEFSIKNWGQSKENNCSGLTLDELFGAWSKIMSQNLVKLESIERSIKKEQKLKSQNNFILKENLHLKEQLSGLQKQLAKQSLGHPRKIPKTG